MRPRRTTVSSAVKAEQSSATFKDQLRLVKARFRALCELFRGGTRHELLPCQTQLCGPVLRAFGACDRDSRTEAVAGVGGAAPLFVTPSVTFRPVSLNDKTGGLRTTASATGGVCVSENVRALGLAPEPPQAAKKK